MTEKKMGHILTEVKLLRDDMVTGFGKVDKRFDEVDKRFDEVDKRFDEVDKRFNKNEKDMAETNRLAQRANVLFEKLNSDVQQIAEGVIEVRMIARKLDNHEDRLVDLEWKSEIHEKALKKVSNG